MNPQSFTSYVQRRERGDHIPKADRIVPLIVQAGQQGMTRKEIGAAVDLERDVLDQLLDGLVGFGLLTVGWENGVQVFRAPGNGLR